MKKIDDSLSIENTFFDEEVRSGFKVSSEMKHVWAAEMKVLSYVTGLCRKHNVPYFADYGTLLGTVRHHGFVPWDDDIDIAFKRKDYMRIMSILKNESNPDYALNGCWISDSGRQPFSSIANYKSVPLPESVIDKFYGCPYVAGIDLYALDYVPRDKELAELQVNMYTAVYDLANRIDQIAAEGSLEEYLKEVENMCSVSLVRDGTLCRQLWQLADRIAAMFSEEESDMLTFFPRIAQGDVGFEYKKEWYDSSVIMKFEGIDMPVPCGYDNVLKKLYDDYMIPVQNASSHIYPYFEIQKNYLAQHLSGSHPQN